MRPAGLRPTSIPSSGTITIYRAVMNPALPTVVYLTPNCWAVAATPSARPQSTPPFSRVRRAAGLLSGVRRLSRSSSGMAGSSTSPPDQEPGHIKGKGPQMVHPHALGHKGRPPDHGGQNQNQRMHGYFPPPQQRVKARFVSLYHPPASFVKPGKTFTNSLRFCAGFFTGCCILGGGAGGILRPESEASSHAETVCIRPAGLPGRPHPGPPPQPPSPPAAAAGSAGAGLLPAAGAGGRFCR